MAACAIEVKEMQRSQRAMNRMDPDTKLVHARLEEWASWAKDPGIMGYPSQSLTEKAAKYGKLGIPQEPLNKPESVMPDHVALVDAAICALGKIDRQAIELYYKHWEPASTLARKLGQRERQFHRVLQRARWRISTYILAKST